MSETEVGAPAQSQTQVAEATGATVHEAVNSALAELGIDRDHAEVEVVTEGVHAAPGERISGGGGARVRVRALDDYAVKARGLLEELLARMEIPARVTVRRSMLGHSGDAAREPVILDISGDDLGLLIGWRGENLRALQTVVNLMTGDNEAEGRRLVLDVERYRARREDQVRELALRLAHRVKRTGQRYTLDPMHAYERRVIHVTLQDDEGVRTESTGLDPSRRVTIHPTGPAQGGPEEVASFHGIPRGRPPMRAGFDRRGGYGGGRPPRPPYRGPRPT